MAGAPDEIDAEATGRNSHRAIGERLLRILSHPIRIEILRVLSNRVASPKELAEELGEVISNISYHFKYLRQEGCVEIVRTEQRRGAIEHYYGVKRSPVFEGEAWAGLSWTAMELDERGWRELVERQVTWVRELERIGAEAAARLTKQGGPTRRVATGAVAFEAPLGPGFKRR